MRTLSSVSFVVILNPLPSKAHIPWSVVEASGLFAYTQEIRIEEMQTRFGEESIWVYELLRYVPIFSAVLPL